MRFAVRLGIAAAMGALAACGSEPEEAPERQNVLVVGSSTVYPFAVAVGEDLAKADPTLPKVVVESIGTGEGIERFCAGAGRETPDIANASRRMTKAEFDKCKANGVADIVELQVGLDGIAFVSAADRGIEVPLTSRLIYRALAAKPDGEEQTAVAWSDVDPSLPNKPIVVYGPPATSGTRDALKEMIMHSGCGMASLRDSDPARYDSVCGEIRNDSAYVDNGEEDEAVVRKVANNPDAIAIFGYSYFEENQDKLKALLLNGVAPNEASIAGSNYLAARPLYIYVKKSHLAMIPSLAQYLQQWAKSWARGGPLEALGLVPAPEAVQEAGAAAVTDLPVMDGASLQ